MLGRRRICVAFRVMCDGRIIWLVKMSWGSHTPHLAPVACFSVPWSWRKGYGYIHRCLSGHAGEKGQRRDSQSSFVRAMVMEDTSQLHLCFGSGLSPCCQNHVGVSVC